jgi:Fe-S-cluster containining protein
MGDRSDDMIPALEPDPQAPTRHEIEDGLRLMHHHALQSQLANTEVASTLKALIDTLVASGALPPEEFERRRHREIDVHVDRLRERPTLRTAPAVDKYALEDLPDIDCASILPICKARCCKFTVCLSSQDLDERLMSWNYSRPYELRRNSDGYCVHSDGKTRGCTVYVHRPAICRTYDCRQDKRIWADFERRILQSEA